MLPCTRVENTGTVQPIFKLKFLKSITLDVFLVAIEVYAKRTKIFTFSFTFFVPYELHIFDDSFLRQLKKVKINRLSMMDSIYIYTASALAVAILACSQGRLYRNQPLLNAQKWIVMSILHDQRKNNMFVISPNVAIFPLLVTGAQVFHFIYWWTVKIWDTVYEAPKCGSLRIQIGRWTIKWLFNIELFNRSFFVVCDTTTKRAKCGAGLKQNIKRF